MLSQSLLAVTKQQRRFAKSSIASRNVHRPRRRVTTRRNYGSTTAAAATSDENRYNRGNSDNDDENNKRNDEIWNSKYRELMEASKLSLAPMMEYTDRHFRHLVRLLSRKTLLYTEMVAANALSHERRDVLQRYQSEHPSADFGEVRLKYDDTYLKRYLGQGQIEPLEGPSVLQLGGSDPQQLYAAAQVAMDLTDRGGVCDYTAINLNCGCPSPKVAGKGCFGAALMEDPSLVADLTRAVHDGCAGRLPVTVKCRIGTDANRAFSKCAYETVGDAEEYRRLCGFIESVAANGVVTDFSVHARIAVLQKSFSPADNRKIPPLKYDLVRQLVRDYSPDLTFTLNGGVDTLSQVEAQLEACPGLNGVMVGRAFAADPWSFAVADRVLYGEEIAADADRDGSNVYLATRAINRLQVLQEYGRHADYEEEVGDPTKIRRFIVKAITPLFAGEPNSKRYRIALEEIAGRPKRLLAEGKSLESEPLISELILNAATEHLSEETLLCSPFESYNRRAWEEEQAQKNVIRFSGASNGSGRSRQVGEWQSERKQGEEGEQEQVV